MPRTFALFLLALSSLCFAQDDVFADGFNYPRCEDMTAQRSNLAVVIAPAAGSSDLKLRAAITQPVKKGIAIDGGLIGQGGTPPYVYSEVTSNLSGFGITLNADGTLTGSPTTVGLVTFLAKVQDAALGAYTCTFSIRVHSNLKIVAGDPPDADENAFWDYVFAISGNTGSITWSTSGSLPTGLGPINSSTGELSGSPGTFTAADYVFTVTATDGGSGDSIDIPCKITVYPDFSASPISTTIQTFNGSPIGIYSVYSTDHFDALAIGKPPYSLVAGTWTSTVPGDEPTGKPEWIDFDQTTGLFSGVAAGIGIVGVHITVTDALGVSRLESVAIHIIDAVAAPGATVGNNNVVLFNGTSGKSVKDSGLALSGSNTGDVTLGAFGSSPDAKGATLAGQVLTLQPADATHPGEVSTGSQTFAGTKTGSFVLATPRSISMTGDVAWTVSFDGSGNVTAAGTLATAQPAVHTWALAQTFTTAPIFTDASGTRTNLGLGTAATHATGDFAQTANNLSDLADPHTGLDTIMPQSSAITAGSTVDLATSTGRNVSVSGNTTINAFGTLTAGIERVIKFTGTPTITHNGTSLILPTAANITAAAGDTMGLLSLGSGNWKCQWYMKADGTPLAGGGGGSITLASAAAVGILTCWR